MDRGKRPLSTGMQDILDQFEDALTAFGAGQNIEPPTPSPPGEPDAAQMRARADSDCEILTTLLRARYAPTRAAAAGEGSAVGYVAPGTGGQDVERAAAAGDAARSPPSSPARSVYDTVMFADGGARAGGDGGGDGHPAGLRAALEQLNTDLDRQLESCSQAATRAGSVRARGTTPAIYTHDDDECGANDPTRTPPTPRHARRRGLLAPPDGGGARRQLLPHTPPPRPKSILVLDPPDASCGSSGAGSDAGGAHTPHRWSIHSSKEDTNSLLCPRHVDVLTNGGLSTYTTARMPAFPATPARRRANQAVDKAKAKAAPARVPTVGAPRSTAGLAAGRAGAQAARAQAVVRIRRCTGTPFGVQLAPQMGCVRVAAVDPHGAVGKQSSLKAGDVIVAIDGERLVAGDCARAAYLLATAGRVTSLVVQAGGAGAGAARPSRPADARHARHGSSSSSVSSASSKRSGSTISTISTISELEILAGADLEEVGNLRDLGVLLDLDDLGGEGEDAFGEQVDSVYHSSQYTSQYTCTSLYSEHPGSGDTDTRAFDALLAAFDGAVAAVCPEACREALSYEEAANMVAQFDTAVSLMQHKRSPLLPRHMINHRFSYRCNISDKRAYDTRLRFRHDLCFDC